MGKFYQVNASTGAGTLLGDGGVGLQPVIAGDGTLYGFSAVNMYSIDLSNGALTFIRTTPDPTNLGVFFDGTPVLPEPSTLSLLATGMFVCISLAVWRKDR
jgi:hypothetical protein